MQGTLLRWLTRVGVLFFYTLTVDQRNIAFLELHNCEDGVLASVLSL
jgi:hypothetical protein